MPLNLNPKTAVAGTEKQANVWREAEAKARPQMRGASLTCATILKTEAMMKWFVVTNHDSQTGYSGVIAYREGAPKTDRLVRAWPGDASAWEIAEALEQLAADLRKQP